jgi:hypothetical protein
MGSAVWTPDELRQLSSALLLELFRRSFEFELLEKDTKEGPARKRRRRYDKLFMLAVVGSYGFGRVYAEFRDIYHLLEYVPEVGRGHAFVALKDMAVRRIMWRLWHPHGALRLYVNPRVQSWTLDTRIRDEEWKRKLEEWASLYRTFQPELNIPEMPLPDQTILEAVAEVNLATAIKQVPQGNQVATAWLSDQVPPGNLQSPRGSKSGPPGEPTVQLHTNVGVREPSLIRLTCDALEAERVLRLALDFMAEDPRVDMESEKTLPVWKQLAKSSQWPRPLEQAVSDCRTARTATTKNNAARLMDVIKDKIGVAQWFELFPNSHSQWTR